jgi:Ni2+-binding GTPase involved in maturation of urease and hydrogenase
MQVINKTDLAEAIGADLKVMEHDALRMRDGGPIEFAQVILSFQLARILQLFLFGLVLPACYTNSFFLQQHFKESV